MNAGKITLRYLEILMVAAFLVACTSAPETPNLTTKIEVVNIIENELVVGQIEQKKTFDQCQSSSPLNATIQFSETTGKTSQKSLTLTGSGGMEVGLDKVGELKIEGSVQEYFSVTKEESQGVLQSISIQVPARTRQEYTIIWQETRRTGTIEYMENGERKFIDFSLRTSVELASSLVKDIDCNFPTETPIPTYTPAPTITPEPIATPSPKTISENCIHSQVWKPISTNQNALQSITIHSDGCYSIESLGIFTDNNGTLHLNYREQKTAISSGIYTPINNNSVIEFRVFVNSMYIVYAPAVIVNFAVAPLDDVMTARNSARFSLLVEENKDKPIIHFALADVNEYTGTKLGTQHYEYKNTYTIRLELVGNIMKVYINGLKIPEEPLIPIGQKVFYIGYNIPIIAGVDVDVKDITVDGAAR